jgi:hypothetical protein
VGLTGLLAFFDFGRLKSGLRSLSFGQSIGCSPLSGSLSPGGSSASSSMGALTTKCVPGRIQIFCERFIVAGKQMRVTGLAILLDREHNRLDRGTRQGIVQNSFDGILGGLGQHVMKKEKPFSLRVIGALVSGGICADTKCHAAQPAIGLEELFLGIVIAKHPKRRATE